MNILLVTPRPDELKEFISGLALKNREPVLAENGQDALDLVGSIKPDLVVVDDNLPDCKSIALIREIVTRDAMVNTAVITSMERDDFHEKSEGLGVLQALPENPVSEDARKLILKVEKIIKMNTPT